MKRCDDDVLYPELVEEDSTSERGLSRNVSALSLVENGGHGLLQPLDLSMAARAALELLNLRPSVLGQLFRPVRRYQAVADAKAAAAVMGHVRRLVGEYDLMRRDAIETERVIVDTVLDIDTKVRTHHLDVERVALSKRDAIEAARAGQRSRREISQRSAPLLSAPAPQSSASPAAPGFNATDELSARARVATLKGVASQDADSISDPYVAYAALAFATKLDATQDEGEARTAAFSDVREMIAANAFSAKDAPGFATALRVVRAEMKKAKSAKAGLGSIAAAIRGDAR